MDDTRGHDNRGQVALRLCLSTDDMRGQVATRHVCSHSTAMVELGTGERLSLLPEPAPMNVPALRLFLSTDEKRDQAGTSPVDPSEQVSSPSSLLLAA